MEERFVKEKIYIEKTEDEKDTELIRSVIRTKMELDVARQNFEYAEGELIDYYSYKIKAEQSKLDYLLKKVKKKSLVLDMINGIKLRLDEDQAI